MTCSPDERLSRDQMMAWVTRRLGYPRVAVELHPCHLEDAYEDARDWYLANKGISKTVIVPLVPAQQVYPYPDGAEAILNVIPPGVRPPWSLAIPGGVLPYDLSYGQGIVGSFPWGSSGREYSAGGPLSGVVQSEQYLEMGRDVMSSRFEWFVTESERTIHISPPPGECGFEGSMGIEYITRSFGVDQLNPQDYNLFKRMVLALAKETLAQIRGKYSGRVPGADGEMTLNYADLSEQAQTEIDKLTEELRGSAMPTPFIVG